MADIEYITAEQAIERRDQGIYDEHLATSFRTDDDAISWGRKKGKLVALVRFPHSTVVIYKPHAHGPPRN